MLDTVKEGLLNLALLAYFCLLKHYTRKYPPSFKSQKIWRNFIFSLQPTVRFFFKVALLITHSIFIALAGKKKVQTSSFESEWGSQKMHHEAGARGRLQEGIFTSGVYIFHEEGNLVLLCHRSAINCSNSSIKLHREVEWNYI